PVALPHHLPSAALHAFAGIHSKCEKSERRRAAHLRDHSHPIPNEFLGGRGDAATALAKADYDIDAATGSGVNDSADVGDSCRASAASSPRAEPAAERTIAKKTVG